MRSLDRIQNLNFLFNSHDIIVIPADECFAADGKFSIEPIIKALSRIRKLAKSKSKTGINILGTLAGELVALGRYEDAVREENLLKTAANEFEEPTTVLCLYKSIPEDLEDRVLEYHDLIVKRAATSARTVSSQAMK
ncbi:MAG: hypothetical protein WAK17_23525 [Candidatus Nitrosopolaris sp.]